MESIFYFVLTASLYASAVGIIIILIKTILKNKINAFWHYFIWIVLILKLLMPYGPKSAISFFSSTPMQVTQAKVQDIAVQIQNKHSIVSGITDSKQISELNSNKNLTDFPLEEIAAFTWSLGALIMFSYLIITGYLLKKKLAKNTLRADTRVLSILNLCKNKMKVNGNIEIVFQNVISTPSLFGLLRPKILLSNEILNLSDKEIEYIILHELAHYKRKDIFINYLLLIFQTIHWFNPVMWYCFKRIRQDMEPATDEKVLGILENHEHKEYGKALLTLLESFSSSRLTPKLLGMVDDKKSMERRINMIKMSAFFKGRRKLILTVGVILVTLLSGALLTNAISKESSYNIGGYSLKLPSDWKVIKGTGELVFQRNGIGIGGVQIEGSYQDEPIMLPNHSEVKSKKDINNLITKAVLVNLNMTQPAAAKDASVINENHLYLIFEKSKTAYDIYGNTKYISESQLLKIGKSFKLLSSKELVKLLPENTNQLLVKYVGTNKTETITNKSKIKKIVNFFNSYILKPMKKDAEEGILSSSVGGIQVIPDKDESKGIYVHGAGALYIPESLQHILGFTTKVCYFDRNSITKLYDLLNGNSNTLISSVSKPDTLDKAVSRAILSKGGGYAPGEVSTEGHIILGIKQTSSRVIVYTISSFGEFGFENGIFTKVSGSGAIPTVITFTKDSYGNYFLADYKEPEDGSYYIKSLKKMFPSNMLSKVVNAHKRYPELAKQQEAYAKIYLESKKRKAEVSEKYVQRKLLKINVEASNKLVKMKELYAYPYWLGSKEQIENGVRYIYETSQSKTSDGYDLITYKKSKTDGKVVREYKFKIVGNNPLRVK